MVKTRHFVLLFLPLIGILIVGIIVQIGQFRKTGMESETQDGDSAGQIVPIFSEDPVLGDKKSRNTIIVFSDFACAACGEEDRVLSELIEFEPTIAKIVWKGLSVVSFPVSSEEALHYGICANRQGRFVEFKRLAFERQANLSKTALNEIATVLELNQKKLDDCLSDPSVDQTRKQNESLAERLHIQEVPTVFLNGKQIQSPNSIDAWRMLLEKTPIL